MKVMPDQREKIHIQLLKVHQVADALGDGLELIVVKVPIGKTKEKKLEKEDSGER